MIDNALKADNLYTNRLFSGIHASTQLSHCKPTSTSSNESQSLLHDAIHDNENEPSNDTADIMNVKLINIVRSKYGMGNFASLFADKMESACTPLELLTQNYDKASSTNLNNKFSNAFNDEANISMVSCSTNKSPRSTSIINGHLITSDDDQLKSIFKIFTIQNNDTELPKLEDSPCYQTPLMRLPNEIFDETIAGFNESIFVEPTETTNTINPNDEPSIELHTTTSDNDSECSTSVDNEKRFEKSLHETNKYIDNNSYKYLNSATCKFDQMLNEFTEPVTHGTANPATNVAIEKLLNVISERDEEIVQLRQECAQLNNYIKTMPTRETLKEQIRNEMLSVVYFSNAEINNLKSENRGLKLRLLDMESLQFEKDKRIQQLLSEHMSSEREMCNLNRKMKLMEINLEDEKMEKMELSMQSLKNQKEERIRGRFEWCKKWELEKFDKMQIEKVSTDRLQKICKLEKALNEVGETLKNSIKNENKLKHIIRDKNEELAKCKNEIAELKSLILVSKTQNSLINTYQSKLEDLTCQLDNEKMLNQKDKVLKTLVDEELCNIEILDESFKRKIDVIVDKIRITGKNIQVDWICNDMFKVQGRIVQLKLVNGKVCALRNGTPFPLELLLLN
ncbi:hypothetical protein BMR1_03g01975 [Babesia microti strain RI]|uniref:Uncharacterized protein n=1 Tax=Babesia microti (strain RI) TaxID=1133968 RepID=A0A0K3AMQ9_BABMR|nr:hypothetical protein BMR1_03g01975 [Babesia microti strain RI]CTQ40994.1 hypothetical protein BMR1_03g01975 [Babesia microti strain RI]|eukprot:XP_012649005.1 hypothetical protein BMR1_03g01975 [Babesia microti strain RI]